MNNIIAVVLGRNYTSRLGMIRAAGACGCEVHVVKTTNKTNRMEREDSSSKYVISYHEVEERDDDALLSLLEECFAGCEDPVILLPTDDYTASVIDKSQDRLKDHFRFPNIANKAGEVIRFMDKELQKSLAAQCGLSSARGWTAHYSEGLYSIPDDINYPVFVKPQTSFRGSKLIMGTCQNREELVSHLETAADEQAERTGCEDILIEEFLPISKEYAILGFSDGDKVVIPAVIETLFMHRGVTAVGTIYDIHNYPDLLPKLTEFIRKIGFTGLFDIDLYQVGEEILFNELNLRFGASGYAILRSGMNLPAMLIRTLAGKPAKKIPADFSIPTRTFASEKVCFQEYWSDAISFRAFKKTLKEADFTFLKSKKDPGPYRAFVKEVYKKYTKRRILRLGKGVYKKAKGWKKHFSR